MNKKQIIGNIRIAVGNILVGLFFFLVAVLYVIKTGFGPYTPHIISFFILGISILLKGYLILTESIKMKNNKPSNKHFNLIIKICNYMAYISVLLFILMCMIYKK